MKVSATKKGCTFNVYIGDAKSLLAFDLDPSKTKNLAGFTIHYSTADGQAFYVYNDLQFEKPALHAQDPTEPATSSINAPIHRFRWVHVPGSLNQGVMPFYGEYTYTATPRYFDDKQALLPIDHALDVSVKVNVGPFSKGAVDLGFTRGYVQSQAFVHKFGQKALFRPSGKELLFDTARVSGKDPTGNTYTFAQEYAWLGFTARSRILGVLDDVLNDASLCLDVFAYDLDEPDVMANLLALAEQGRVRVILDNASLHHTSTPAKTTPATKPKKAAASTPEDQFESAFASAAKAPAAILRGHFGGYAHDKVFIVSKGTVGNAAPLKVLTGSTNFSITGVYVNSNHVLVFNDTTVATAYANVFDAAWAGNAAESFNKTAFAAQTYSFSSAALPKMDITFSPHLAPLATSLLDGIADRINQEATQPAGNVLFAVMDTGVGSGSVRPALLAIHKNTSIFTYGISDSTQGIYLYSPGSKAGVKVTGKPGPTVLPPPFDQVASIGSGHQIHHKFVVCGFNGKNPVVYCGSSNLALGGEESNGDNLLAIRDADIVTVFTIEALALVDHFSFLDRFATKTAKAKKSSSGTAAKAPAKMKTGSKQQAAALANWYLSTTDKWAKPYFDPQDLHYMDRELFG